MSPHLSGVPEPQRVTEILPEHLPIGELSIAVFGPGEGEAIVVRLPDGSVGVVDGCREPEADDPRGAGDPVRELLAHIEAEPRTTKPFRLAFVCLTHPHADHYRGLGRLLDAYEGRVNAVWAVSQNLPRYGKQLVAWAKHTRAGKDSYPDKKTLLGLTRVIEAIHRARDRSEEGLLHLISGRVLLRSTFDGHPVEVDACGPSDNDVDQAGKDLVENLRMAADGQRSSRSHDPNLTSGAIVVRWGASAVLLAGDLLAGDGRHSGWQHASRQVRGKVQVVNVAHHASAEAHHDALWTRMEPRLAIVTPFKSATGDKPPRPRQISHLAQSAVVAITSPPAWARAGDPNNPRGRRPLPPWTEEEIDTAVLPPGGGGDPRRNAVAVSLDAAGNITRLVLAGAADIYDLPSPPAPTPQPSV